MPCRPPARRLAGAALALAGTALGAQPPVGPAAPLWRSDAFVVTDSSVRQGPFEAVAVGRDTIVSSYPRAAREVRFRFSLDRRENEFPPGTEHTIYLRPEQGRVTTPLYVFGVEGDPEIPLTGAVPMGEEGTARVTFRVDLRHVLRALREEGRYQPPLGAPVTREGFEGVHVVGDVAPLDWDYAKLEKGGVAQLGDPDGDGIYEGVVPIATEYTRPTDAAGRAVWGRRVDLAGLPTLASPQRLLDATYRLSLEELRQLVREDGALSAGAKWPGVWTRDVSLASVLSLALVAPDAVRTSLVAKVDSAGRIIQDTGTGGSWPVSTDRAVWALAAWELYAATGDRAWLRQAYDVTRRSAEADLHAARDTATGLFRGESSFLDWREQSYPRWMQPADIHQGQALGTNAVHLGAYRALAAMARALGEPAADAARWDGVADAVAEGMRRHLWMPARGWFGQYRYGRNFLALSPRAEALGEALAVLGGAATPEQRARLMAAAPVTAFGPAVVWPSIPGERNYHNNSIWPFVTAYWAWAAADAGSTRAVEHGLASLLRTAALFLTNKENLVATTGHFEGTALNSDRQLWSVAGTLAATYRLLFGIRLEEGRMAFRPMVPPAYAGERTLAGLRYRGATLTVVVRGHGSGVARSRLDGRPVARAEIPASLTGAHTLELDLDGRWPEGTITVVPSRLAPATPRVTPSEAPGRGTLAWAPVAGAVRYEVWRNGRPFATTRVPRLADVGGAERGIAEYQVLAVDTAGLASFLSAPVRVGPRAAEQEVEPEAALLERTTPGFAGRGYVRLTRTGHTTVRVPVQVTEAGTYAIDVRYANGNGPVNTEDKAALRTLLVGGEEAGVLVMPQRGSNVWSDWGWSNPVRVALTPGTHTLTIAYTARDENMNRQENTALLDHVRVTRLAEDGMGVRKSP